ncbi:MAG: hypothetical protein ACYCWW_17935, partial [Deltaproteobacteria bacterium]
MRRLALLCLALAPGVARAQLRGQVATDAQTPVAGFQESDRFFPITQTAATMPTMGARVGTVDQLETLQGRGNGFAADVFGELAPLSWLTVGATANYSNFGDSSLELSPTAYARGQFLRASSAGVDAAGEVQYKQQGFNGANGELEASVLLSRRLGRLELAANAVYGKSYSAPDADAEGKLGFGYDLLPNLILGADSLTR